MQLQIKGKNLVVSDSVRTYAERKLAKLDRMVHADAQIEIELAVEKNPSVSDNQVAEATVRLKGHTLRAREASGDMKASIDVALLRAPGLELYAEACGWALARGHARSGRRIAISAYMGAGDRFDQGIADFAVAYADQMERDYEVVLKAIKAGKIPVETGI